MGLIAAISLLAIYLFIVFTVVSILRLDRARIGNEKKPQWFTNLPAEAQKIHLKELHNETATRFSWAWFLEYWHGKRSAFYAIVTWFFVMPVAVYVILTCILAVAENYLNKWVIIVYAYCMIIFLYFVPTIIFRCTNNSPPFWKYTIRVLLTLYVILLTLFFCAFNFYTVIPYIASYF